MSTLRRIVALVVVLLLIAGAVVAYFAHQTRARIDAYEAAVLERAARRIEPRPAQANLPAPVARYFDFVFPDDRPTDIVSVTMEMAGDFRRPGTESFEPTTARQVVHTEAPNMVFSADTPIAGPVWAIAYDAYIGGEMTMKAKLLSTITVMSQQSTPELNRTSLRRWLIESPAYPMALLPGGPVTWEPADDNRARAVVRAFGEKASLVATFREDGSLARFDAEADGDLTTPYHGSGEHTSRSDYQLVDGVRVPMAFEIARAADGEIDPFWRGRITSIRFGRRSD